MYDVVIVGYGPTGMLAALLLGRAGLSVAVLERYPEIYGLPRVGIVHDDVLRMFQEVGIVEAVWPDTHFLPVFDLVRDGKVLMESPVSPMATHGWPEYVSIFQPAFETELDRLVREQPGVEVFRGQTVVDVVQTADSVTAHAVDETGKAHAVEGRYLIGADGGGSQVREALGLDYEDLGFDQDWLVVDARMKRPLPHLPPMRQYCEPDQPGVALQIGPSLRRWSFMIFEHESREEAAKPENVWKRLDRPDGAGPDDVELIRIAPYRFRSLLVRPWRRGRAFLAGDSAHQMPPLLAQGLCSGLRDAYNLSGKLALVLKGLAGDGLLDAYEAERSPNARATIVESQRVAGLVIERDPEKCARRDADLLALAARRAAGADRETLIAFRVPGYSAGFIGEGRTAAGDAFPQARVAGSDGEGRFDDVAGRGFLILARGGDPEAALGEEDRSFWRSLGGRYVRLADEASGAGEVADAEGLYGRLMDEYGCQAIVKRDDHHIFAAASTLGDLPDVLSEMRRRLSGSR